MSEFHAILLAGGSGTDGNHLGVPHQFVQAAGRPLVMHSVLAITAHKGLQSLTVVCERSWAVWLTSELAKAGLNDVTVVPGGETAEASLRAAVAAMPRGLSGTAMVLIHEAVRPLITGHDPVDDLLSAAEAHGSSALADNGAVYARVLPFARLSDPQMGSDSLSLLTDLSVPPVRSPEERHRFESRVTAAAPMGSAPLRHVDFVLGYEHERRELFGLQLLNAELQRRGYSVEVIDVHYVQQLKRKLSPIDFEAEVVVWPQMYSDDFVRGTQFLPGWTGKLVNLQIEQIYSPFIKSSGWHAIRGDARNAFHVAWGDAGSDKFRAWGVDESRIWQVGSMQLDAARPELAPALRTRDELAAAYGLRPDARWGIFFSSFVAALMDEKDIDRLVEKLDGFMGFHEHSLISKNGICEWIMRFCDSHPEVEFIYRPHPHEWAHLDDVLPKLATMVPNFHYINEGTALEWALASDRNTTWISTSMVDVALAGKPFAMLRPYELGDWFEAEVFHGASFTTTFEEFEAFVMADEPETAVATEVFAHYYDNFKGDARATYQKLADKLERLLLDPWESPFPAVQGIDENLDNPLVTDPPPMWDVVLPYHIPMERKREADLLDVIRSVLSGMDN